MTDPDPKAALAAIEASRRAVHERVASKGWRYDLIYAGLITLIVTGQALKTPLNATASAVGVCLLAAVFTAESRRTGVRVLGVSPKNARWVAIAMGVLVAGVMFGMVALQRHGDPALFGPVVAAAGLVTFAVALGGSRLWRRVYRAEMGA